MNVSVTEDHLGYCSRSIALLLIIAVTQVSHTATDSREYETLCTYYDFQRRMPWRCVSDLVVVRAHRDTFSQKSFLKLMYRESSRLIIITIYYLLLISVTAFLLKSLSANNASMRSTTSSASNSRLNSPSFHRYLISARLDSKISARYWNLSQFGQ